MAYEVTVIASGIKFYLVGRKDTPGTVVHKFQVAMIAARNKMQQAIALVNTPIANLNQKERLVLEYCFNPTPSEEADTAKRIAEVLSLTLKGLSTPGLKIYEPDPFFTPKDAEGYVPKFGPLRGNIHTKFDLSSDRVLNNIIHEATHKFAGTEDKGYISHNIGLFLKMRLMGVPGGAPINNAAALENADSFSAFAANL